MIAAPPTSLVLDACLAPDPEQWLAGQTTDGARAAWRVAADPNYRDVVLSFGEQALTEAGWVDDLCSPPTGADTSVWPLCTPLDKLRAAEGSEPPVVLLCTGSYSPPHLGHVAMLDRARHALEAHGHHVAGGYMSPSHDSYVAFKYPGALPAPERVRLCRLAVDSSDWLMCCPWEALWTATAINFTEVIRRLQSYLRAHWDERTEVVYCFGADNSSFALAFNARGRCVIVPRDGHDSGTGDARLGRGFSDGRIVVAQPDPATSTFSSTRARSDGVGLSDSLSTHITELSAPANPGGHYMIRDDLAWACGHWQEIVGRHTLAAALNEFRGRVLSALKQGFAGQDVPPFDLIDLGGQRERALALGGSERVISLDLCTPADHHLHVCRRFALADGQFAAGGLSARPGYGSLEDQLAAIPGGDAVLLDDDLATGFTRRHVEQLLEGRNVAVTGFRSLMEMEQRPVLDVVDLRDFLIGARDGGLVVGLDGDLVRAPYLPPWVSLPSRAKIPLSSEAHVGMALWEANAQFFAVTGLRVDHAAVVTRPLLLKAGAQPDEHLSAFCQRELRRIKRLPYQPG